MATTPNSRHDQPPLTAAECDRLKRAYRGTYNNGARLAFQRQFPPDADRDGYPAGFRRWPRAKQRAWLLGAACGFHERLRYDDALLDPKV